MMLRTFRDAIYLYYLFSIGWSLLTLALAAVAEIATLPMLAGWLRWPSLCLVAAGVGGLLLLPFGRRPSSRHGYRISGWYLFSSCGMMLLALVKLADV